MRSSVYWSIKKTGLFQRLADEVIEKIAQRFRERRYKKGDQIFGPADVEGKIYILKVGEVKLYELTYDGKKFVLDVLGPGSIFGDLTLAPHTTPMVRHFAECSEPCVLCVIPKDEFLKILKQWPDLALRFIETLAERLNRAEFRLKDVALNNAQIRLINALVRVAEQHGRETKNTIHVGRKVTHEELAEMVGATRETVTKALNQLRREKCLKYDTRRRIILHKGAIESNF